LIIGAYGNDEGGSLAGQSYLIYGDVSGLSMDTNLSDANASWYGEGGADYSGSPVSYAGDVNGDGYDDLIISAVVNKYGGNDAGQSYLIYGDASGLSMRTNLSDANASWYGEGVGDLSGSSVSYAGDVNGDGYDDLIIGAWGNAENRYEGQSYLIYGGADDWSIRTNLSGANASWYGENSQDDSGDSVSYAGDVNGDGYDDLIIGAAGYDGGSDAGQSYLVYGDASGLSMRTNLSDANASWYGEDGADFSGSSVFCFICWRC